MKKNEKILKHVGNELESEWQKSLNKKENILKWFE